MRNKATLPSSTLTASARLLDRHGRREALFQSSVMHLINSEHGPKMLDYAGPPTWPARGDGLWGDGTDRRRPTAPMSALTARSRLGHGRLAPIHCFSFSLVSSALLQCPPPVWLDAMLARDCLLPWVLR